MFSKRTTNRRITKNGLRRKAKRKPDNETDTSSVSALAERKLTFLDKMRLALMTKCCFTKEQVEEFLNSVK